MKILFILCLAVVATEAFLFSRRRRLRLDCTWIPWREGGCVQTSPGVYKRQRVRVRIQGMNGGTACPTGSPMKETRTTKRACSERQYVASQLMKMIGAGRAKDSSQGGFSLFRSNQRLQPTPSSCTRTTSISAGGVELLGAKCSDTGNSVHHNRFRRTAAFNGSVASYNDRDILFLVDESGSVGTENFKTELRLVKALADKFCDERRIGRTRTKVALTTFGDSHTHHIDFDNHTTRNYFIRGVDRVSFGNHGTTCGVRALEAALEHFHERSGSRVTRDKFVDGLVILITDGCFNCFGEGLEAKLKKLQKSFHKKGVFVMAFMINVDNNCKDTYKHLYDGSVCFQGLNFPSWGHFENLIEDIEKDNECINKWNKNEEDCP